MSVFTVGRIGLDTAAGGDGLAFQHPLSWSQQGTQISMHGVHKAASDDTAVWFVGNFTSMDPSTQPEEPVVPITSATVPTLNGYFRVLSARAEIGPSALGTGTLIVGWQLTVERAQLSALPMVEGAGSFGAVANDEGVTNNVLELVTTGANGTICGVPGQSFDMARYLDGVGVAGSSAVRTTDTGTVRIITGPTPALPISAVHVWCVDENEAYDGSCSIRGTFGATGNLLFLGRAQVPLGGSGLIISNGLIRMTFSGGGAPVVQVYDSGAWVTVGPSTWSMVLDTGGTPTTFVCGSTNGITILANSPELVTVRVAGTPGNVFRHWFDISVQRGARHVAVTTLGGGTLAVAPSTNTASTSMTGGLRQTANDGFGNRFVLCGARGATDVTPGAWTRSTVVGSITQTCTPVGPYMNSGPFCIGSELGGSSATGQDTAQAIAYEFFAGRSESARVVAR